MAKGKKMVPAFAKPDNSIAKEAATNKSMIPTKKPKKK